MMNRAKYVYGPVPSRRLGRSLGVELVPFKVCNYDCVYCQLGRTQNKTMARKEYASPKEITRDLRDALQTAARPDYITISGSGEPTLNSSLGETIAQIKEMSDIPVAVLTNGSLLHLPEVRSACCMADLVLPSLDAADDSTFQKVNRPHPDIEFTEMLEGLVEFRGEYSGKIWLEVFMLGGMNDSETDLLKMRKLIDRIKPDKVQINTVSRPPAEDYALMVGKSRLLESCALLANNPEVIADFSHSNHGHKSRADAKEVLALISHRPCTIEDIAQGLKIHPNEVVKLMDDILEDGSIVVTHHRGKVFYSDKHLDDEAL